MISHWLLLGSYANFVSLVSFMNDPIFAAPRRQEGFASEKQKLLEDCRRRLSKMATFSKGERDVFVATKTTAGNKSMTSNQSSWHKWKLGRIVWLWHIQFAGLFVGTCISRSYLEQLWEVVQMWNFNMPWNYQKAVWLHFFSLNCTGWCQVSAQMSKCQRKSEVELEQLDICFSFPVDSWLNGFENTASMNKLLEAFSSSRPHSLCSHQMPSLWRRRLALISAQERSAQEALQHRQQIQQQVNELGPGLCCYDQGPGQFGRNCRAQNDVIHLRKV